MLLPHYVSPYDDSPRLHSENENVVYVYQSITVASTSLEVVRAEVEEQA